MKTCIALLFSCILTAPAFADYTASATLDWSALTFSGIPILIGPSDGPGCTPTCIPGGILQNQWAGLYQSREDIREDLIHDNVLRADGAFGSAISQIDSTQLVAAVHATGLLGDGTAGTWYSTDPSNDFRALGTGSLRITIPYLLAQAGVHPLGLDPQSGAGVSLFLGASHDSAVLLASSWNGEQRGTLSVTQFFQTGDFGHFNALGSVFASVGEAQVNSVPEPSTGWLLALGLIGLAWWGRRCAR